MKRFITQTLLVAGGLALVTQVAQAGPDDLVLGFTLGTAANDYIVDLGPGSTIGVGGSSAVNLSTGFGFSGTTLSSTFGGNLNGVTMGVLGGQSTGLPGQDLWVTQVRSAAGDPTMPGSALQGALQVGGANGTPFPNGVLNGTGLSAGQGIQFSRTDPNSFSTLIYNGTPNFVTTMGGLSPAGTIASGPLYEDLYQEVDSASGPRGSLQGHWAYQGFFTLDPTADTLTFTPAASAVPEPSTYGLIAGAGLLVVFLRRQFMSKWI